MDADRICYRYKPFETHLTTEDDSPVPLCEYSTRTHDCCRQYHYPLREAMGKRRWLGVLMALRVTWMEQNWG
jgi:hypothetical protein